MSFGKFPRPESRSTTPQHQRTNLNSTRISSSGGDNQTSLEVEADLAYNDYLQNAMKRIILQRAIDEKTTKCNDTLACISERVFKLQHEELHLLERVEEVELSRNIDAGLSELRETVAKSERMIDGGFRACLRDFVQGMEHACCKLHLENVVPLKSIEEYERFNGLIAENCTVLEKMIGLVGDVNGVEDLAGVLREILEQFKVVEKKCCLIGQSREDAALRTLEEASKHLPTNV